MLNFYITFGAGGDRNKNVIARNIHFCLFFTLWGAPLGVMTIHTYLIPNVLWTSYHMLHFYILFGDRDLCNKNVIARNTNFSLFFLLWGSWLAGDTFMINWMWTLADTESKLNRVHALPPPMYQSNFKAIRLLFLELELTSAHCILTRGRHLCLIQ